MKQVLNFYGEKFPNLALVIWPLVPLSILAFISFAEFHGKVLFNHVNVYLYFLVIAGSALVAFIFSLIALPKAIKRLKLNKTDRTSFNYISVVFSIIFDLSFLICTIWLILKA